VALGVAARMADRYGVWTGEFPADMTRLVLDVYLLAVGSEHLECSRQATMQAADLILRNRRHGLRLQPHAQKTLRTILAAAVPEVRASLDHLARSSDTSHAIASASLLRKLEASEPALH
ncbi:hypothetical protein, partial [Actinoplanes philippinensis]|uniref:hypothetical protein n=1 Tax=Actinoplanes philippinensis TaxID=35752 RepID=UPI00340AE6EC